MKAVYVSIVVALLAAMMFAQTDARQTFAEIKTLDGTWSGTTSEGKPVKVSFRDTSGGSAVLSEIEGMHEHDMVSMIHLDNNRLLLTHYCGIGNQPRMQASVSPDNKSISFDFVDGTNIPTPDSGHMQKVVFAMADANHHTETWTFVDHGQSHQEVFTLTRTEALASKK
jgi:hypothetical protein